MVYLRPDPGVVLRVHDYVDGYSSLSAEYVVEEEVDGVECPG